MLFLCVCVSACVCECKMANVRCYWNEWKRTKEDVERIKKKSTPMYSHLVQFYLVPTVRSKSRFVVVELSIFYSSTCRWSTIRIRWLLTLVLTSFSLYFSFTSFFFTRMQTGWSERTRSDYQQTQTQYVRFFFLLFCFVFDECSEAAHFIFFFRWNFSFAAGRIPRMSSIFLYVPIRMCLIDEIYEKEWNNDLSQKCRKMKRKWSGCLLFIASYGFDEELMQCD